MSQDTSTVSTSAADMADILKDYVGLDEYNATLDALNEAIEERDKLRADGEKHSGRVKELEGKVRGRSYRDAYDKARKELRIKDEFADDVFKLADLKMDADEPDEGAIRKTLEAFVKDRRHYLDTEERPAKKALSAGEGASRGQSGRPGEPEFRVTNAQLKDAGWMRDNQGKMLEAKRAGLLVLEDEV